MDNEDLYWDDMNDYEQTPDWNEDGELSEDDLDEPSVCDNCDRDHWECMLCCDKCYEMYGECPNEDCNPMDI